jgi:hypothetical protein
MPRIMKKHLVDGAVFSIKIEGGGYTAAQLRDDCQMDFFDIVKESDEWDGVDFNKVDVLFCIVVAAHRLLKLFNRDIQSEVIVNSRPRTLVGLSYTLKLRYTGLFGFNLVEYDNPYNPNIERVLIENLDPIKNKDVLYSYENLGMNGSPDKIRSRLSLYFLEGINWDPTKSILYPELSPPPKGYERVKYTDIHE